MRISILNADLRDLVRRRLYSQIIGTMTQFPLYLFEAIQSNQAHAKGRWGGVRMTRACMSVMPFSNSQKYLRRHLSYQMNNFSASSREAELTHQWPPNRQSYRRKYALMMPFRCMVAKEPALTRRTVPP